MGNATTRLFEGVVAKATHVPGAAIDFDYIGRIVIILLGLYILSAVFNYIQGYITSILSLFGAIALMGIVVNDSLVMVSAFNRRLKDGMAFEAAMEEAALSRFRPVLLTSLTTIAGLGPLVFERSRQAQFLSPMAISIAYGLLFGTILTLVMLPSMLVAFNRVKLFLYGLIKGERLAPEAVESAVREEVFVQRESNDEGCV